MRGNQAKDLIFLYVAERDAAFVRDAILGVPRYEFIRRPQRKSYSTTLSRQFKQIKNRGVVFLIIDRKVVAIASYTTSRANITNKKRVSARHVIKITPAIDVRTILNALDARHSRYVPGTSEAHEVLLPVPDKTKRAILDFFKKKHPEIFADIRKLYDLSNLRDETPSFPGCDVFQQEKDSLLISLSLVPGIKFDVEDNLRYSDKHKDDPFKLLLSGAEVEDDFIYHDASNFGDTADIGKYSNGVFRYSQPGTDAELVITNCNRKRLEHTLGVDLIIYNEFFKSYLLLQYKRMTKTYGTDVDGDEFDEGDSDEAALADSTFGYRPDSDANFAREMKQMTDVYLGTTKKASRHMKRLHDWRLGPDFLFFKICGSLNRKLVSGNQISGIYLPLSYTKLLLKDDRTLGSKGGRILTYGNCPSYLNKDTFQELAKKGLIGSSGITTDQVSNYIRMSLKHDKSVVLTEIRRRAK